jgi:hypothetical protein
VLRRNQREVFPRAKATAAGNITKDKTAKLPKKPATRLGVISIVDNMARSSPVRRNPGETGLPPFGPGRIQFQPSRLQHPDRAVSALKPWQLLFASLEFRHSPKRSPVSCTPPVCSVFSRCEEFDAVSPLLLGQKLIQRMGGAAGVAKIPAHFQIERVLGSCSHTCSHRENSF